MQPEQALVTVIGAGQAGLAVSYFLAKAGLIPGRDLVILDRGPASGGAWQHRWESLRLGDAHRVHDLPGMSHMGLSFADADTTRPAREQVRDYYAAFEAHYGLQVRRPAEVTNVFRPDADRFRTVLATDSSIDSYVLVNASGTWGAPNIPEVPGREDFTGRQLHTQQYQRAEDFSGLRVAVVGGGTSAVETVGELSEVTEQITWFTRRPLRVRVGVGDAGGVGAAVGASKLTPEAGLASVKMADDAARAGKPLPSIVSTTGLPLTSSVRRVLDRGLFHSLPMFTRVVPNGVIGAEGEMIELDAIIWATGFRAEVAHLAGLGVPSAEVGLRVVDGQLVDFPGLIMAGYGPQASTITANRAGRRTSRDVLEFLRDRGVWPG